MISFPGERKILSLPVCILCLSVHSHVPGRSGKTNHDVKNFTSSDGKIIVNTMYPDRIADLIKTKKIRNKDSILVLEPAPMTQVMDLS
ncbi:MAG: hypothetical protein CM1200mP3_05230 [Chloroflexota bacterium]|nr:MAG: hypothetical protein CM1200mP3_05230 [Chloroflexota bacterium]